MTTFWDLPFGLHIALISTIIYFIAGFLQGNVGFGSALVASPLLILLYPRFVPSSIVLSSVILGLLIAHREHSHIKLRLVALLTLGRVFGIMAGAYLLSILSQRNLTLAFAILLLIAVTLSALRVRTAITSASLVITGILSGIFGTVAGIGGVVVALLFQDEEPAIVRSNIAAFTVIGNILSAAAIWHIGRLTVIEWKLFLILLPGLVAGFLLSSRFKGNVNKNLVRTSILVISGSAAIWLIIKYFFGA